MATVCLDRTTTFALCVLLNHISIVPEQCVGFRNCNGVVKTLSRCFHNTDGVRVSLSRVADVVRFVEISMEAAVIECYVYVHNVAIAENPLIRYTVADDLVNGCAD